MPIAIPTNPNATSSRPPPHQYKNSPLVIILPVILLVVFIIGFVTLYLCKCFFHVITQLWNRHNGSTLNQPDNNPGLQPVNPGLEQHIIQSFPVFPLSLVKDLREDRYALECAICLLEFEDELVLLRLLMTCHHVFHQECIDRWLESHKTCPVCRRNLDPYAPENIRELNIEVIEEHRDENLDRETTTSNEVLLSRQSSSSNKEGKVETSLPDKFSRSKTTGHSIERSRPEEEEDRHTLRLPDHVKIKVTRRHNNGQTESCISFDELFRNRGGRFGEVSG